jgi:hypothetical protein
MRLRVNDHMFPAVFVFILFLFYLYLPILIKYGESIELKRVYYIN